MPAVRHTRIVVARYGGPEVLQVVEEECPEPKRGEARVRVLAAGVSGKIVLVCAELSFPIILSASGVAKV